MREREGIGRPTGTLLGKVVMVEKRRGRLLEEGVGARE